MTIILPRLHRQTDYKLRKVSSGGVARSAIGGAALPMTNLGDHWALEIESGTLSAICGRELLADIVQGSGTAARAYIPQIGIEPGAVGLPKVMGAGQNGSVLAIDGFTPYAAIRKGWFFTVANASLPSLHIITAEVIADATGEADVAFWPGLRTIPADNTVIEMVEPWIEGLIDEGGDHDAGLAKAMSLDTFVIEEAG